MTRNNNVNKSKWKTLLTLLLISLLCFAFLLASACGKDDEKKEEEFKIPSFNYSEPTDESTVRNSNFAWAVEDYAFSDMPKTSVTGWSRSSDNLMTSTSAKSGVINVSDTAWGKVAKNLYDHSYFYDYFWVMYDMDDTKIADAMKADPDWAEKPVSTSNKKAFFIENYINSDKPFEFENKTVDKNTFGNPGKYSPDADDNVYMLNNYLSKSSVGLGTAQSIKSDSDIVLEKGGYGKVTVWVKTQNVGGSYADTDSAGATIYLTNSLNKESQADFGIFNIIAEDWTQFTIYVKADDNYETTFSINLGLGYDKFSATEGTAYFDDVVFTPLTAEEFANENTTNAVSKVVKFNSEDAIKVLDTDLGKTVDGTTRIATAWPVVYSCSIYDDLKGESYLVDSGLNFTSQYTTSNKTDKDGNAISGGRFDTDHKTIAATTSLDSSVFPYEASATQVKLTNASYTIDIGSKTQTLKVKPGEYAYVEFYVKNQLSKLSDTTITIDLYDIKGDVIKKRPALATITETSDEWAKVSIIVNNNFTIGEREFYLSVVIGPTDVASATYVADYANGEVSLTYPNVAFGIIEQYDENGNETANYQYYSLFSSSASATTSLYAGSPSDSQESTESQTVYDLTVAPSDLGSIESRPATPKGYQGIVADHFYVKEDSKNRDVNTSKTAGLINTKYLSNYTMLPNLATALGFNTGDEDIQPLVIYNPTPAHYGYVSQSYTINKNAKAKVEVTLRVVDDAKAYIYLVNTGNADKKVMTFGDFTANVNNKGEDISNGKQYNGEDLKLFFEVDKNTMNGEDWITVEFFVANGVNAKDFRVEVWNGGRDNGEQTASTGYVFVSSIKVSASADFKTPTWKEAFTVEGNPLYDVGMSEFAEGNLILYKQELTDIEKQYNDEYDDDVTYSPSYIWAKNDTFVYAVYNTIEPDVENPYDKIVEEEEEDTKGCKKSEEDNPASFWLSFSSILLGATLFLALLALVVKNIRRRRKANRSDAKSHYKITSRTKGKAKAEKKSWFARLKEKYADEEEEEVEQAELVEEQPEEEEIEQQEEQSAEEQTLDEYVYGDVQDFGESEENEKPQVDSQENNEK
ncbi:MAG: hypothetical protein IJC07_01475 [Clostridia bacterium]|nr:hypothetical protein [Clostridia bacterium]